MKHLFHIMALGIIMFLTSCASQKALTGDVQSITAKVETKIKAFNMDESVNGTLKMKRDKAIQLSLTKFGIEGARVIFTPDSILLINKLTKTYLRSSFKELDKMAGGENMLTFANIQEFFWNDKGQSTTHSTLPIASFIPIELKTSYSHNLKAGKYRIPMHINMEMSGADGAIQPGAVNMRLKNVRASNDWEPNTEISSKYKSLNLISFFKQLLKKGTTK